MDTVPCCVGGEYGFVRICCGYLQWDVEQCGHFEFGFRGSESTFDDVLGLQLHLQKNSGWFQTQFFECKLVFGVWGGTCE